MLLRADAPAAVPIRYSRIRFQPMKNATNSPTTFQNATTSPDSTEAIAAMMNDRMTPGPAVAFATSPATTYIPVPTQLPTPSDTRSTVVRTLASPTADPSPSSVRSSAPCAMEPTGLVRSRREHMLNQASPSDSRPSHAAIAAPVCHRFTAIYRPPDTRAVILSLHAGRPPLSRDLEAVSLVCLRLFLVVLADLEVAQLVRLLVGSHDSQPVAEVVLLQGKTRRHLLENCFSDVTLILFFRRPTCTTLPRFPVLPLTLILSLRKVSYGREHTDTLGKRTLV
ncbi:hypothetical protein EYF80_048625 [Liparis tanakae]|uniref:Uncharacterized protein n=1 Tax=Liparis tanakae TaxID=230148 RepID=A0A4Z2FJ12_9TELE|nr:hypothetical protein EYF80_048625 [Liparis tanakae]